MLLNQTLHHCSTFQTCCNVSSLHPYRTSVKSYTPWHVAATATSTRQPLSPHQHEKPSTACGTAQQERCAQYRALAPGYAKALKQQSPPPTATISAQTLAQHTMFIVQLIPPTAQPSSQSSMITSPHIACARISQQLHMSLPCRPALARSGSTGNVLHLYRPTGVVLMLPRPCPARLFPHITTYTGSAAP
jgi:hypothetical protein